MTKPLTSTALVHIDDVVDNLPFIVRRDHRIVAAFAKKMHAEDWARDRSWSDESKFTVHTAREVVVAYQDKMSRRLVPMPKANENHGSHSQAPLSSWPYFAFVLVTAVVYYYAGKLILLVAAVVLFCKVWLWLCYRYPRTMWLVLGFIRGLIGRRR